MFLGHFQREEPDWLVLFDGDVPRDVQNKRGFTQRRARAHDKHIRAAKPRQNLIQAGEAGTQAAKRFLAAVHLFKPFIGLRQFLLDMNETLGHGTLGNGKNSLFNFVQRLFQVARSIKSFFGNVGGGVNEVAQNFFFFDQLRVVADICRRRHRIHQFA